MCCLADDGVNLFGGESCQNDSLDGLSIRTNRLGVGEDGVALFSDLK